MSRFVNFNQTCSHFNIVDDFSNGCEVGTDCGLVMHDRIYAPYDNRLESIKAEKSSEYDHLRPRQFYRRDNAEGMQ